MEQSGAPDDRRGAGSVGTDDGTVLLRKVLLGLLVACVFVPQVPFGVWVLPDTGSMEPSTVGCDLHVYSPVGAVEEGDVVIYDPDWRSGLVVHRVVEARPDGYVFQGDNNRYPDPEVVQRSQLVAEVRFVAPTGRYVRGPCGVVSRAAVGAFERAAGEDSTDAVPWAMRAPGARPIER
jgi:signal peptidase I